MACQRLTPPKPENELKHTGRMRHFLFVYMTSCWSVSSAFSPSLHGYGDLDAGLELARVRLVVQGLGCPLVADCFMVEEIRRQN